MRRYAVILLLMACCRMIGAQLPDSVSVGFVTCYPGPEVYELEGHSALHISGRINEMPVDLAVNYGIFDFNSPNFVYRFVKGETDYLMGVCQWDQFAYGYLAQGRRIVERHIDLDSLQSRRLLELLNDNYLPQNRVYRYNYVKDNCATRPLRMLERAIGDSIILGAPQCDAAADSTFRQIMARYHKNYPWYQFGIDLALGSGIDYTITDRQKSFAPAVLDSQLAGATVGGRPLCDGVRVVNEGTDVTLPPTPWPLTPMAVCWAAFIICAIITWRDQKGKTVSKWFDTLLYTIFGIAGLIITFLIFVSVHEATSPNWLYLWLNPLCLVVPIFIWLKKCKIVVYSYQIVNFALLFLMISMWHFTSQTANPAFWPLVVSDALRSINYLSIVRKHLK